MQWNSLVEPGLATRQRIWERNHLALRMRDVAGFTFREIGLRLGGVSAERARQFVISARFRKLSPVESWMRSGGEIHQLSAKIMRRLQRQKRLAADVHRAGELCALWFRQKYTSKPFVIVDPNA